MGSATKDPREREHLLRTPVALVSAASGEGSLSTAYTRPLLLLLGYVGDVPLVGCLNLGNLQLARLSGRQREIGVRVALGASRGRILRQLMIEDLLLLFIGGRFGAGHLPPGEWTASPLGFGAGAGDTARSPFRLGALGVGILLLLLAQVGFSILPAWQSTRNHPAAAIHAGRGNIGGSSREGAMVDRVADRPGLLIAIGCSQWLRSSRKRS